MKYLAFIWKDGDTYLASLPDLGGTMTQAETFESILEMAVDAAECWLQDEKAPEAHLLEHFTPSLLKELDIPSHATPHYIEANPKEKYKKLMISMPESLLSEIDKTASQSGETRSGWLQVAAKARLQEA